MDQLSIFDAIESQRHKEMGMAVASDNNAALLLEARNIAIEIAKRDGDVDADRVTLELVRRGHRVNCLGNAAGSIFRDRRFTVCPNQFVKATRIQSKCNLLRVWKLAK